MPKSAIFTQSVLENVNRRISRLRPASHQRIKEQRELDAVLSGRVKIERRLMCKNCKLFNRHYGKIKIRAKTDQLERTFMCSECGLLTRWRAT